MASPQKKSQSSTKRPAGTARAAGTSAAASTTVTSTPVKSGTPAKSGTSAKASKSTSSDASSPTTKPGARKPGRPSTSAEAGSTTPAKRQKAGEPKAGSQKSAKAADLLVKPGESPWTIEELTEVREQLESEIARHESHARAVSADLADLLDSTDSGGGDSADVGTSNFERDQELTLAAHAQEALGQCRLALQKIDRGTYGQCDQCGEPIGKGRLQVYPRATLCMTCKQREERR
ncbi:MAG: TraR/DksA family transcriptional regulator [Propionibacteriales bacterium]|nr:TraR/DksA family transcriptional regulator [Propionibacteriales bacterium]